jgi:phage-related protein
MNEPFIDNIKGGLSKVKDGAKGGLSKVKGGVGKVTDVVGNIFDTIIEEIRKQVNTLPKKFYNGVIKPIWNKIKWLFGWIKLVLSLSCCCSLFVVLYYTGILRMLTDLVKQIVQLITSPSIATTTTATVVSEGSGNNSVLFTPQATTAQSPSSLNIFDMPNFNNNVQDLKSTTQTGSPR